MSEPSSSSSPPSPCYWLPPPPSPAAPAAAATTPAAAATPPTALCFGTGRFLRSVLVPLLQRQRRRDGNNHNNNNNNHNSTAVVEVGPALIQTRGTSFVEHMMQKRQQQGLSSFFEVDSVFPDGSVRTDRFPCGGAFSMRDRASVYDVLLPLFALPNNGDSDEDTDDDNLILGVGVTEAGLASAHTPAMRDLYGLLRALLAQDDAIGRKRRKICVINTDNVPRNGDVLRRHMMALAAAAASESESGDDTNKQEQQLRNRVAFLDTMVDRITSHRASDAMVPRAEGPVPQKALVVLDPHGDLPRWFAARAAQSAPAAQTQTRDHHKEKPSGGGLVLRQTAAALDADIALKLRVANGTHTALAHAMALSGLCTTDRLLLQNNSGGQGQQLLWLDYLDALARDQILPAATTITASSPREAAAVWADWRARLAHPHFGLSTFFITQNGAAKGGLRLGPTVVDLITNSSKDTAADDGPLRSGVTVTMAFAWAALLRWLTPAAAAAAAVAQQVKSDNNKKGGSSGVYKGWLQGASRSAVNACSSDGGDDGDTVVYADGLRYNLKQGWYEFRCACEVRLDDDDASSSPPRPVSDWLAAAGPQQPQQPAAYLPAIRAYLEADDGGKLASLPQNQLDVLARAIAALYARMVAGDDLLAILQEMKEGQGRFSAGMQTDCCALLQA